jgi:lipopolysaccharide export system permease protein
MNKKQRQPLVSVIERMIGLDLAKTLMSVWAVIVVIIVSREFIRVLAKAVDGQVANDTLLAILSLKTIASSIALLPAALFMAVLMVLGRLYRDQEMAAIASAGGGVGTIYRAVFVLVFPLAVLTLGLSLSVAPWAEASIEKLIHQDKQSADIRGIAAGKFSEYSQGDLVFYVESISADKVMHSVFVQQRQSAIVAIINAKTAKLHDTSEGQYLIFSNGERVVGQAGQGNYEREAFAEYAVRIAENQAEFRFPKAALASSLLLHSKVLGDIAELQRRLAIPLGVILLSFLAVPLAQISPRGGVYGNMAVGFLIYFTYGNFVHLSQVWVTKASIPAWLGSVGIHVFLLLIGLVLLARLLGWRWLFITLKTKLFV